MHLRRLGIAMLALVALLAQSMPARADAIHDSFAGSVNAYRASRGLPTVAVSPTLQKAAQWMAEDVATNGVPAVPHISSDGRTPQQRMADAGYPVSSARTSEIIAWGATTVAGAMNLWLNSAPHYAVLNDPQYVAAGFGVACWGTYPCVWVVDFGSVDDRASAASQALSSPFHAAFYAQSGWPTASPGQTVQWVVAFTNTGAAGWLAGSTELHVGTNDPQDSLSALATSSWLDPNRPARQTTTWVGPGQQAWFVITLKAPSQPGTYRLYVRPVIDGVTWLEDAGAYVDLTVR